MTKINNIIAQNHNHSNLKSYCNSSANFVKPKVGDWLQVVLNLFKDFRTLGV